MSKPCLDCVTTSRGLKDQARAWRSFAALLSLEPLDVLDCTSKNEAWRRSPLNIGSVKPTHCATICCAPPLPSSGSPTDFQPTADVGSVNKTKRRSEQRLPTSLHSPPALFLKDNGKFTRIYRLVTEEVQKATEKSFRK